MNRRLVEELNNKIFRRSEISGIEPLEISKVLLSDESMPRRESDITKFFDEKETGFTYKKFKALVKPGMKSVFGIGADAIKKVERFAARVQAEDEKGEPVTKYDEYIETFFIYLYYQLFVKLFSNQELIVSKNADAIKNAKDLLSAVPESLEGDMDENLVKLYKSFYSIFAASMGEPTSIAKNEAAQNSYFESFANQNITMFTSYPISVEMQGSGAMNMKQFMDELFDSLQGLDPENTKNKQIASIKMLSEFVSGTTPDFDVVRFQELTNENPSFLAGQNEIKFPTKIEAIVGDAITELASIDDLDGIGMEWASGTKWEPYIKLLCAIVCLEEISDKVKSIAKTARKQKSEYQKRLDIGEQDGGVYFINNQAFVAALNQVEALKEINKGLSGAIEDIAKKTAYFQTKTGKDLIEAMFVRYDSTAAAIYEDQLGSRKKPLEQIMLMTELMPNFGTTFPEVVANINMTLLSEDGEIGGRPSKRNEDAIRYAMDNVGDFVLPDISKSTLSAFSPSRWVSGIKEIASTTQKAFSKIFSQDLSIDNVIKSFNDTFSEEFDFAEMQKSGETHKIVINGEAVYEFKTIDDLKKYINYICISMGSIMYHSKVAFGKEGSRDSRYKEYFNVLSWLVKTLSEKGKLADLGAKERPFAYLITPFFLDTIKYSFRTFVNEIEDVLDEAGLISPELREKIKESHKRESMEEEEWKPLVDELSSAIAKHLEKVATK